MTLGTEVDLGPRHIVLDGAQLPSRGKGHSSAPCFRPMSIVAKRSPISATAGLLFFSDTNVPQLVEARLSVK